MCVICTDTRPFVEGKTAILRTMLTARRDIRSSDYPPIFTRPVHCLWVSGRRGAHDEGHLHSQLSVDVHGWTRDQLNAEYLGSCATNITEADMQASNSIPRFVTIVSDGDGNLSHIDAIAWVHVDVVPLVAEVAHEVHQHYSWGRGTGGKERVGRGGPFLTPKMHEDGDGHIATCTSTPLTGNGRGSAYLPEWLAFQKVVGVSKVFMYLLDPGPIELKTLQHYEQQGLVELWGYRMSHFLSNASI